MYQLLLNLWVMKRVTADREQAAVTKSYITQAEADMILATPQIAQQG